MKLTKYQKARLLEHEWDVYTTDDGEQNCAWISITPEDGAIFGQVVEELGLTGEGEDVKLLIVATSEDNKEEVAVE
tara:strand:+ start:949 stop:1176 length:228 start_codon:yes stop_codon:yes gene_type:complete